MIHPAGSRVVVVRPPGRRDLLPFETKHVGAVGRVDRNDHEAPWTHYVHFSDRDAVRLGVAGARFKAEELAEA